VSESEAASAADQGAVAGVPGWFCDQCGARFYGPGVCSNSHPANDLKNIAATEAAETGADDTPAATDGAVTPEPEPEPETATPTEPVAEPVDEPAPAEPVPAPAPSPLDELRALLARAVEILNGL
jgi:hypothetical protein